MVVVRLICGHGKCYYAPVDGSSFGMLINATGYGWFSPDQWQKVEKLLVSHYPHVRLSAKWYHIQRRSDHRQGFIHLLDGITTTKWAMALTKENGQ